MISRQFSYNGVIVNCLKLLTEYVLNMFFGLLFATFTSNSFVNTLDAM